MRACLITIALIAWAIAAPAADETFIGRTAPDFRLQDQYGDWHELQDFQGRWLVMFFYPAADTPGCTAEACNFRDNIYAFRAAGAEVVGISVDPVEDQKAFAEKYRLPFTLLSDPDGTICQRYNVLTTHHQREIARRESFVIDPAGRVVRHYTAVDPDTHAAEVIEDLKRLQADDHGGTTL